MATNYDEVIKKNKDYLTQAQVNALAAASNTYNLQAAGQRAAGLQQANTQYDTAYRGLQNVGLAGRMTAAPTSGEVPRLGMEVQDNFNRFSQRLEDVQNQRLSALGANYAAQTQQARAAEAERLRKEQEAEAARLRKQQEAEAKAQAAEEARLQKELEKAKAAAEKARAAEEKARAAEEAKRVKELEKQKAAAEKERAKQEAEAAKKTAASKKQASAQAAYDSAVQEYNKQVQLQQQEQARINAAAAVSGTSVWKKGATALTSVMNAGTSLAMDATKTAAAKILGIVNNIKQQAQQQAMRTLVGTTYNKYDQSVSDARKKVDLLQKELDQAMANTATPVTSTEVASMKKDIGEAKSQLKEIESNKTPDNMSTAESAELARLDQAVKEAEARLKQAQEKRVQADKAVEESKKQAQEKRAQADVSEKDVRNALTVYDSAMKAYQDAVSAGVDQAKAHEPVDKALKALNDLGFKSNFSAERYLSGEDDNYKEAAKAQQEAQDAQVKAQQEAKDAKAKKEAFEHQGYDTEADKQALKEAQDRLDNLKWKRHYGEKVSDVEYNAAQNAVKKAQLKVDNPQKYAAQVVLSDEKNQGTQAWSKARSVMSSELADEYMKSAGIRTPDMNDNTFKANAGQYKDINKIMSQYDQIESEGGITTGLERELKKYGFNSVDEARKWRDEMRQERDNRSEYEYYKPALETLFQNEGMTTKKPVNQKETDPTYRMANNLPPLQSTETNMDVAVSIAPVEYMTKDQLNAYNAMYEKNGIEAANQYAQDIAPILKIQRAEADEAYRKEMVESGALGAIGQNLLSVGTNLVGGVPAMLEKLGTSAYNAFSNEDVPKYIDTNSYASQLSNRTEYIRNATSEKILEDHPNTWGKVLNFAYQTGMSMADSAAAMAVSGVLGSTHAVDVLFFSNAGNEAYKDARKRGATQEQAMAFSVLSGAAEALFEHVSLETFADQYLKSSPAARRSLIKKGLIQAGVEASEELTTELANKMSDAWVMKDKSEYNLRVKELQQEDPNMTEAEAKKAAFMEALSDIGMAALGGLASGLGFGIGGTAIDTVKLRKTGKAIQENGKVDSLVRSAQLLGGEVAEQANAMKGKQSPLEIGKLFREVETVKNEVLGIDAESNEKLTEEQVNEIASKGEALDVIMEGEQLDAEKAQTVIDTLGKDAVEKLGYNADSAADFAQSYNEALTSKEIKTMSEVREAERAFAQTKAVNEIREDSFERVYKNPKQGLAFQTEEGQTVTPMPGNLTAVAFAEQERNNFKARTTASSGNVTYAFSGMQARDGMSNEQTLAEMQKSLTKEARGKAEVYEKLSNALGIKMTIHDVMPGTNGYIDESGNMHVVLSGKQSVLRVAAHELTHWAKEHNSIGYASLRNHLISEIGTDRFDRMVKQKAREYGLDLNTEKGRTVADDEVCAELCERMLSNEEALERFAEKDTAAAKSLKDRLLKILNAIKQALKSVKNRDFGESWSDLIREQDTVDSWVTTLQNAIENAESKKEQNAEAEQVKADELFMDEETNRTQELKRSVEESGKNKTYVRGYSAKEVESVIERGLLGDKSNYEGDDYENARGMIAQLIPDIVAAFKGEADLIDVNEKVKAAVTVMYDNYIEDNGDMTTLREKIPTVIAVDNTAKGDLKSKDQSLFQMSAKLSKALGRKVTLVGKTNAQFKNAEQLADVWEDVRDTFGLSESKDFSVDLPRLLEFIEEQADTRKTAKDVFGSSLQDEIDATAGEIISAVQDMYESKTGERFSLDTDDSHVRFSIADDELSRKLNSEETVKVYRAMQLIDGKLYPPMAAKVKEEQTGKNSLVQPTEIGQWYVSDERPDLIDPKTGTWKLDKANGSSIQAAYNPYFHTSTSPLNDQFSSAYKRDNLVVVEGSVPKSELTSGYHAQYAKDPVGAMRWHSGPVSSKLSTPRTVILSRYFKADRILSNAEVAKRVASLLKGENVAIPQKVVTPGLYEELNKLGVPTVARFSVDTDAIRQAFTVIDTEDIEDGLEALKDVKHVGMFALKDISRMLDASAGKNKDLRNTLSAIFEKPHSEATGRYARGVERMQQRVLDIAKRAGVVDAKGKHFDSKKSAAIQNIGEGFSNTYTNLKLKVKDAEHVTVQAYDPESGKLVVSEKDYTLPELKKAYGTNAADYVWSQVYDKTQKAQETGKQIGWVEEMVNTRPYTMADLQEAFPRDWQQLKRAADEFRDMYDEYIRDQNNMLATIYPIESEFDSEERVEKAIDKKQERLTQHKTAVDVQLKNLQKSLEAKEKEMAGKKRTDTKAYRNLVEQANRITDKIASVKAELAEYEANVKEDLVRLAALKAEYQNARQRGESDSLARMHRLQYRSDYFHHFTEMASGIQNLHAIFTNNTDISPKIVGKSENTKAKTKWAGYFQQRMGGDYTADAINGMLKYGQLAEYKLAFDPLTAYLRDVNKQIRNLDDNTNRDGLIRYIDQWADAIAGKSHKLDRNISDLGMAPRKAMQILNWINSRVIQNTLLYNMRSALIQISNITNAKGIVKSNLDWLNGLRSWALAAKGDETMAGIMSQSNFLTSRYMDNLQLTESKIKNAKAFGGWMLGALDEISAKATWWAAYQQYTRNPNAKVIQNAYRTYENAIDYADDVTRRTHAGRGVGELAPAMTSRVINFVAPFQVEVNNTFQLMKDNIKQGNYLGLLSTGLSVFLFNALFEGIVGSSPLQFDFIRAVIDIVLGFVNDDPDDDDDDYSILQAWQRLSGEAFGSLPYAGQLASILGEDTAKKLFGEDNDATRYGNTQIGISAVMNAGKGVKDIATGLAEGRRVNWVDDLDDLLNLTLPFGAKQLTRTIEGVRTAAKGYAGKYDKEGNEKVQFATDGDILEAIHAALFGKWSLTEASEYFGEKRLLPQLFGEYNGPKSATGKQVDAKEYKAALDTGITGKEYFTLKDDISHYTTEAGKREEIMQQKLTAEQKADIDFLLVPSHGSKTKVENGVLYKQNDDGEWKPSLKAENGILYSMSDGEWQVKTDYTNADMFELSGMGAKIYTATKGLIADGMNTDKAINAAKVWDDTKDTPDEIEGVDDRKLAFRNMLFDSSAFTAKEKEALDLAFCGNKYAADYTDRDLYELSLDTSNRKRYEKGVEAKQMGMPVTEYVKIMEKQDELKERNKKLKESDKDTVNVKATLREEILNSNMTAKQKQQMDDLLFDDEIDPDYEHGKEWFDVSLVYDQYHKDVDHVAQAKEGQTVGLSPEQYVEIYNKFLSLNAKDENGKTVNGLKKKRATEYLDSLGLPKEAEDFVWQKIFNYSKKKK